MTSTIINLSALIDMPVDYKAAIDKSLTAFANALKKSPPKITCASTLFASTYASKAWVATQYLWNKSTIIDPYKMGKLTTEAFLKKMAAVFPSLEKDALIKAWNSAINLDDKHVARMKRIIDEASEESPVYLMSFSNELNVSQLLKLMRLNDITLNEGIDISCTHSDEPVAIAPNVFLCLSYRYGLAKSAEQSKPLLKAMLRHSPLSDCQQLSVVSQYQADRDLAVSLGVPVGQVSDDKSYFSDEHLVAHVKTI